METVNTFETLRVLHFLWKKQQLSVVKIGQIVKESHNLELISLTNSKLEAKSLDGKIKYTIK